MLRIFLVLRVQFAEKMDMTCYDDFVKKFKEYADYPEIAKNCQSEDFFTDNLCSEFFQWVQVKESQDKISYVNRLSGEQVDKNPFELIHSESQIIEEKDKKWFWVPHPKYVWLPGRFISNAGGSITFEGADHSEIKLLEASEKSLIPLDRFLLTQTTHDLISIHEGRNEAFILYILANRYYKGKIYTALGDNVLLSINPSCPLPIYSENAIDYYKKPTTTSMPPHVFKLAKESLESLVLNRKSQSIIIVGESGSGKTEACKHIIKVTIIYIKE